MPKDTGDLPSAQALALSALVTATERGIASRVLARTGGGNVTLFAFDAGQGLSEHTAKYDAVVQVLDGEVLLTIGGKEVSAGAGDIVLMPANVPHALHASKRFKMLLTMIRG